MTEDKKQTIKTYIIAIAIPLIIGLLSTLLTKDKMDLYKDVTMPPLSPPSILFPIVWSILYILMGISSAIIWQNRKKDTSSANVGIVNYAISLIFNLGWSIIFFDLRQFLVAFIWLLVLLYFIIRTIISYKNISRTAAYLQIPYVLWVAFAGYLNIGVWYLNR